VEQKTMSPSHNTRHRRPNPVKTETDARDELIEALERIEAVHASFVKLSEIVSPDFDQDEAAAEISQAILDGLNAAARPIANALAVIDEADVEPIPVVRYEDDPQYGDSLEDILCDLEARDDDDES
jgi:hypothetical protein